MSSTFKSWISAARPRTLPLTLASIFMGSFLAANAGKFNFLIFSWCVLTTICLQILSNLANDYGDSVHGADGAHRQGPQRAVAGGKISAQSMKTAIGILILASLLSGVSLLYVAFGFSMQWFLIFLGLGIASIIAAITYTMGKKPYGYAGLGDISVLLFFGMLGVGGSYFLYTQEWNWLILGPALSCGLFATAVLNVNNIRDIESDRQAGKRSIPVRLGRKKAVLYHKLLLLAAFVSAIIFTLITDQSWFQWIFMLTLPLFIVNIKAVRNKLKAEELDPYLKQLALSSLLFTLLFGLGLLI